MSTSLAARTVAVLAAIVLHAGCTHDVRPPGGAGPGSTTPSPSAARSGRNPLCQPFPDRLIDELVAAYDDRDLEALEGLVVAPEIEDLVAGAYAGESSFDGAAAWARAAWDAGDRIHVAGYGAFHPSRNAFQMFATRRSERLRAAGIERVSTTLDAHTDGCTITRLESSGPVQAMHEPCAFYEHFRSVDDVAAAEPEACARGAARFARSGPVVAMLGRRALVWGGDRGGHFTFGDVALDGLVVDLGSARARRIPPPDLPSFRPEASAWTGTKLVVFGATARHAARVVGAGYDVSERKWRRIEFPYARRSGFEGVWTGSELLLWGGPDGSKGPHRRGLAYTPSSGTWRRTSPAPVGGRWSHAAVWTGSEMIVWGGGDASTDLADGAAYDPATDSWRKIAPAPLAPRQWLPLAWTGDEVVVWGGSSFSRSRADGAAYDPATDSWRKLAPAPIRGRHHHSVTWTGEELIVFGGYDYTRSFADGAAYDPAHDRWRRLPRAPIDPRFDHAAAWTGRKLLVFGGRREFGHIALGDGAMYAPDTGRWKRLVPRG